MKKIITITFLLCTFLAFAQKKEKVKGSKIVKLEQKEVESFQNLEVADNLEIFLIKGSECALEIEADDNLIEFVEYKSAGNTLKLSTSRDMTSFKKLSVRVTYTDNFKMLIAKDETNVTSLSDMTLDNITFKIFDYAKLFLNAKTKMFTLMANDKSRTELNLTSEKTTIDLSKSAQLKALISSASMKFDQYQKSSATIEGDITELDLRLDNNATFSGEKLSAKSAEIKTEGYANATIMVATKVIIDASGKSEIELYGEPKVELKRFTESASLRKKPSK